jgi:hypothetical protein
MARVFCHGYGCLTQHMRLRAVQVHVLRYAVNPLLTQYDAYNRPSAARRRRQMCPLSTRLHVYMSTPGKGWSWARLKSLLVACGRTQGVPVDLV